MDSRLALMTGTPIPIPECQIAVHQPTLEEISYMGEENLLNLRRISTNVSGRAALVRIQSSRPKKKERTVCTLFLFVCGIEIEQAANEVPNWDAG